MPVLIEHRTFFGRGASGQLFRLGSAATDNGSAVVARWETRRIAPAGIGGEAIFTALFPVVVYTGACTVRFTPIVDGRVYDGTDGENATVVVVLAQPAGGRRTVYRGDLGLSRPYIRDGQVQFRSALRGTWFSLRVDVTDAVGNDSSGNLGVLFFEGVDVEYEVVGRSDTPVASP